MKLAFVVALLLLWTTMARAEDGAAEAVATQPVERLHDALLAAMKDGPNLGFDGRARRLAPVIARVYDLPAMARIAVGAQASRLTPEQMGRVLDAFTRYTVNTYARQFARWDGERFQTGTPRPAHGGGTLVPTHLIPATGQPVLLTYLVRDTGAGGWRIGDVLLDGTISQLAVRRAEFQGVLRGKGVDALVDLLESRAAEQARP